MPHPTIYLLPNATQHGAYRTLSMLPALGLTLSFAGPGQTAHAQQTVQQVEVKASAAARSGRDDTAAKVLIPHEEIVRYGDHQLLDVLRRQPGITIAEGKGKQPELRLRGLGNGYTQILVNGQEMPAGFQLDSIAPELVESIEIVRVAGADLTASSMAGSIHIKLRQKKATAESEWRASSSLQDGRLGSQFSVQSGGALASAPDWRYLLALQLDSSSVEQNQYSQQLVQNLTQNGNQAFWQNSTDSRLQLQQHNRRDSITLTPSLQWQPDQQRQWRWQLFLNYARPENTKQESEQAGAGMPLTSEFPQNHSIWAAHILTARQELQWEQRLNDSAKLSMQWGWNHFARDSRFRFWGSNPAAGLSEQRVVFADAKENSWRWAGKYLAPYSEQHVLSLGWDSSLAQREESRDEWDTPSLGQPQQSAHRYDASMRKLAGYIQDEWTLHAQLSAYLGLRWEQFVAHSEEAGQFDIRQQNAVWSPVLQTLWKADAQTQWRLAVNRTLKQPALAKLIPRRFRVDNNNNPFNPDQLGNPGLRPERAWGLDLGYERALGEESQISVNFYRKWVQDLMLEHLSLQQGIWESQTQNHGKAVIDGLELEGRFALKEFWENSPAIRLRSSLAYNWSRLSAVTGPDNRLPEQARLSAKLGLDYTISPAWKMGVDAAYQSSERYRDTGGMLSLSGPRRHLDAYLSFSAQAHSQWRLSVNNLLQQDQRSADYFQLTERRWSEQTTQASSRQWRLSWEGKW